MYPLPNMKEIFRCEIILYTKNGVALRECKKASRHAVTGKQFMTCLLNFHSQIHEIKRLLKAKLINYQHGVHGDFCLLQKINSILMGAKVKITKTNNTFPHGCHLVWLTFVRRTVYTGKHNAKKCTQTALGIKTSRTFPNSESKERRRVSGNFLTEENSFAVKRNFTAWSRFEIEF